MTTHVHAEAFTSERIVGVVAGADAATLGLLKAVDSTVDAMIGIEKVMSGFLTVMSSATESITKRPVITGEYVDADDEAINLTSGLSDNLKNFLTMLVRKRTAIDKDNRLKDHHCEALHDAYESATDTVAELIDVVDGLRHAIIAHDLNAEPRDVSCYESVGELVAALRNDE